MSEWISVTDRVPDDGAQVIIWNGAVQMAWYRPESHTYRWDCDTFGLCKDDVSHWMPVPEPPK